MKDSMSPSLIPGVRSTTSTGVPLSSHTTYFPHHAWWQLGWIADYVFAEAEMRSGRRISFPRGFMTPKVGPQRIFGFEPGTVYGEQANPIMVKGLFDADNTDIEILSALTTDRNRLCLILMNSTPRKLHATLTVHPAAIPGRRIDTASAADPATGRKITPGDDGAFGITLPGYGIQTLKLDLEP